MSATQKVTHYGYLIALETLILHSGILWGVWGVTQYDILSLKDIFDNIKSHRIKDLLPTGQSRQLPRAPKTQMTKA